MQVRKSLAFITVLGIGALATPATMQAQMARADDEGFGRYVTGLAIDIVKARTASRLPDRIGDIRTYGTTRNGKRFTVACGTVNRKRFVSSGTEKSTVVEGEVTKQAFEDTWKGLCTGPVTYSRRART